MRHADSNIVLLPLMFFLPGKLIIRRPTLIQLPRNLHIILSTQELLNIVESDQFPSDIFNAASLMAFPYFGFKGWKEDYTGYHPAWILSGTIKTWVYMLDKEVGWNIEVLLISSRVTATSARIFSAKRESDGRIEAAGLKTQREGKA